MHFTSIRIVFIVLHFAFTYNTNIHATGGIRTRNPSKHAATGIINAADQTLEHDILAISLVTFCLGRPEDWANVFFGCYEPYGSYPLLIDIMELRPMTEGGPVPSTD
jgi:hypothetical protein